MAFDSCFTMEVTKFLVAESSSIFGQQLGLNSHVIRSGEGIINSATPVQQFEWAFNNQAPKLESWHNDKGAAVEVSDEIKDNTREIFEDRCIHLYPWSIRSLMRQAHGRDFLACYSKPEV
ncbi:hypothetical protein [Phyllobacterium sp. SB3]|uniref:hypothetical protein n=1 Tax=Phyllobacterium sp. SB3 TaxID=3156073 RepID=UPI0032B00E09